MISVVVFNYNHAHYLHESLPSILRQTWKDLELIFVDDASTDQSCNIVQEYQKQYPNIDLIKLEKNTGSPLIPAHIGLKRARGTYLIYCAADDILLPNFFQDAMNQFQQHPNVGICFGDYTLFEDSKPYNHRRMPLLNRSTPQIFRPDELVEACRKHQFQISSHSSIYRKDLVIRYGGYDSSLKSIADYYLNYEIAFRHPVAYVPKIWTAIRVVPNSFGRSRNFQAKEKLCTLLIEKIEKEPTEVQKRWLRSNILAYAGLEMMIWLLYHPKLWKILLGCYINFLKIKFKTRKIYHKKKYAVSISNNI